MRKFVFENTIVPHVGMSIKARLKAAYENVAFNADKTWVHNSYTYQRANQELYAKEYRLQIIKTVELRPRTVKDCIPKSKLAQYSNYEYNESRELSYAPSNSNFNSFLYYSRMPGNQLSVEPWLAPEVDDLFIRFNHFMDQFSYSSYERNYTENPNLFSKKQPDYESPILNVDSFDNRILKMRITSDRIKNIWNLTDISVFNACPQNRNDKTLNVYKTPTGIYFLRQDIDSGEILTKKDFLRKLKMNDFEHLKYLSKSFKEQTSWVLKCTTNRNVQPTLMLQETDVLDHDVSKTDSSPTRRLYSAVLQGLPNNNNNGPSPTKSDYFIPISANAIQEMPNEIDPSINNVATSIPVLIANAKTTQGQSKIEIPNLCVLNSSVKNYPPKTEQSRTPPRVASPSIVINNSRPKLKPITSESSTVGNESSTTPSQNYRSTSFNQHPMTICSNGLSNCYTTSCVTSQMPCISTNCNYQFNLQCSNSYQSSCLISNSFSTNMFQIVGSRGLQSISRQNYLSTTYPTATPQMNMFPQNRTFFYPISQHQYVQQQSYYCTPLVTTKAIPRWVPPTFARSTLSQQTFPTSVPPHFIPQPPPHWITPNPQVVPNVTPFQDTQINKPRSKTNRKPQINILQIKSKSKTQVHSFEIIENLDLKKNKKTIPSSTEISIYPSTSKVYNDNTDEFDEVVNKTVNILFKDNDIREDSHVHVPVTPSSSEELEIQALEQYTNSNDNVYQELERQAEEQYEECSEN